MLSAKPWRLEVVLWFCAAQTVALCLGLSIIAVLQKAGFAAFQPPAGSGAVLLGTLTFQGATWVLIPFFLRQHHVDWRDAFGLHWAELKRAWFPAIPIVIVFLPVVALLQAVLIYIFQKIGWSPETEAAVTVLAGAQSLWLQAYLVAFYIVVGPVAEEFIFRGMLYPFFKQRSHPVLAWFFVSFLFALVHWDLVAFLPLFLLALILTWLYELTNTLLAPITAHALFNMAGVIIFYFGEKIAHFFHIHVT